MTPSAAAASTSLAFRLRSRKWAARGTAVRSVPASASTPIWTLCGESSRITRALPPSSPASPSASFSRRRTSSPSSIRQASRTCRSALRFTPRGFLIATRETFRSPILFGPGRFSSRWWRATSTCFRVHGPSNSPIRRVRMNTPRTKNVYQGKSSRQHFHMKSRWSPKLGCLCAYLKDDFAERSYLTFNASEMKLKDSNEWGMEDLLSWGKQDHSDTLTD